MRKSKKMMIDEIQRVIDDWDEELIEEYSQILIKQIDDGVFSDVGEALWDGMKRLYEYDPHYYELVERKLGKEYAEFYEANKQRFHYMRDSKIAFANRIWFPVEKVMSYRKPPLGHEAIRKFFDEANKRIENGEPKKEVEVLNIEEYPHSPMFLKDIGELLDMSLFGYAIIELDFSYYNDVRMTIRKTKDGETTNIDDEVIENCFKIAT